MLTVVANSTTSAPQQSTETPGPRGSAAAPWVGLATVLLLVMVAVLVPKLTGWQVRPRDVISSDDVAPLHGLWEPKWFGPGTLPAVAIALLGWRYAASLAERLSWGRLLLLSYLVALAWLLSLAFVDGSSGISRVLGSRFEYLPTARQVHGFGGVHALLQEYISRIPFDSPGNWTTHVAGHPPGALLFFVLLVNLGLGSAFAAGMVVTVLAATTSLAVLTTLRALGREQLARRAAPFLVLTPAAVFMAVSADALMAAVAAWGMAALAIAATRTTRRPKIAWSLFAGLLLGVGVMMSYGLPLIGLIALAVLFLARSWWPLPIAAAAALVVLLVFAALGFAWWEAYPVLTDRYWAGIAASRPAAYWVWGDFAALVLSAGPLLGAGLARVGDLRGRGDRVIVVLVTAATAAVVVADLSLMSKAEVERIWLPFIPWMLLSAALLPDRWRRWGLGLQLVSALLVQQLIYTSW